MMENSLEWLGTGGFMARQCRDAAAATAAAATAGPLLYALAETRLDRVL